MTSAAPTTTLRAGDRAVVTIGIVSWTGFVPAGTVVTIVELGPAALEDGLDYAAELADGRAVSFAARELSPVPAKNSRRATMTTATNLHRNTDRGNADCYCRAGADHGNLPQASREMVLRALLRGHNVMYVSNRFGTLVVPVNLNATSRVRNVLRSYSIETDVHTSETPAGRGLFVGAEAFNR